MEAYSNRGWFGGLKDRDLFSDHQKARVPAQDRWLYGGLQNDMHQNNSFSVLTFAST